MKRVKIIIISLAAGALCSSCVTRVEDVFDLSASERLEAKILECQSLLTSPQYGWLIRYYPSSTQSYGGSTYAALFEADGDVTVTGEVAVTLGEEISNTITSHYSINSSSSVVLTFDTYNDYIHYWSDPDFTNSNSFGGDFEWAYVSGDENEMVFRGIKTGNDIIFTALDEDMVSAISKIVDIQQEVTECLYLGYDWDETTLYDDDSYNLLTYYPDGDEDGAYETIPYAFTTEGICFYQPVTINGVTAQEFVWNDGVFDAVDAVSASGSSTSLTLTGSQCEGFIHYDDYVGNWELTYLNTSTGAEATTTAVLAENVRLQSYTLTIGALSSYPMTVTYSKQNCNLALLGGQYLGTYSIYYCYLLPWSCTDGYIVYSSTVGWDIIYNGDPDNPVLEFTDNGVWGSHPAEGIYVGGFSANSMSSSYYKGYVARMGTLYTMTKVD